MEPTPTSISTEDGDSAYDRVSRIRRASKRSLAAPYTPECVERLFGKAELLEAFGDPTRDPETKGSQSAASWPQKRTFEKPAAIFQTASEGIFSEVRLGFIIYSSPLASVVALCNTTRLTSPVLMKGRSMKLRGGFRRRTERELLCHRGIHRQGKAAPNG